MLSDVRLQLKSFSLMRMNYSTARLMRTWILVRCFCFFLVFATIWICFHVVFVLSVWEITFIDFGSIIKVFFSSLLFFFHNQGQNPNTIHLIYLCMCFLHFPFLQAWTCDSTLSGSDHPQGIISLDMFISASSVMISLWSRCDTSMNLSSSRFKCHSAPSKAVFKAR